MTTGNNGGEKKGFWSDPASFMVIGLGYIFFMFVLLGMILYLAAHYIMGILQPFEMATVVALVGGFIFVAAFGEKVTDGLRKRLKRIGSLYLLSTISLVIFGLYQAADQAKILQKSLTWVYTTTFYGGAISFIVAMLLTFWVIPELMETGALLDVVRRKFWGKPKEKE
jgi:Na+/H+-dicarboxylate symporter